MKLWLWYADGRSACEVTMQPGAVPPTIFSMGWPTDSHMFFPRPGETDNYDERTLNKDPETLP